MGFHDPFLVCNLNILIALTLLVLAVTVFITYCDPIEKNRVTGQENRPKISTTKTKEIAAPDERNGNKSHIAGQSSLKFKRKK
ncbi:hypothetical protein ACSFCW_21335 [Yokenella regensburgei]|uniref:hypothetical protein n=1 Tax=Enterobacteriaceae TaxID=543 RepID=UPI0024A9C63F|nr:hypothetical protein [Klebsiella pneumoniae]HDO7154557.1 hypothetical protein [Klebsiella pneumoniae]